MKRLFALVLAALLLFALPASAAGVQRLDLYYACFFRVHDLEEVIAFSAPFDTLFLELFFTTDDDLVYYSQKTWKGGKVSDSGLVPAVYAEDKENFTLTMPDDSVYKGYFDYDNNAVWLDIGMGYLKLARIKEMNPFTDWVKK